MRMLRAMLITAFCTLALVVCAQADETPTLTLDPVNGAVTGPAGSTVGWGFTLTGGSDFAVISGSDFCVGVVTSPCSNSFGTYTDLAGSQFLVAGPGEGPITESFDDTSMTGIGSFAIDPASVGTLVGDIVVTYDLYDVDPNSANFDPTADIVSLGNYLSTAASVTVGTNGTVTSTPEPGTLALLASGLGMLFLLKRKWRGLPQTPVQ
ncbi:MAG: PEP-CTERM sorting domain-containing protein [Candidatus Acidiferrales bacterium]